MSGALSIRTSSWLRRETIACGVFAGTTKPYHACDSYPGTPASATVGSCGRSFERRGVVTASARSLPSLMKVMALGGDAKPSWVWPATRSIIAGPPPL